MAENLDLRDQLSNTGLTNGEVLKLLNKHNPCFVEKLANGKVKKLSAKDISDGKGFLSRVFRIKAEFDDLNNTVYTCMLKIPTYDLLEPFHKKMDYDKARRDSSRRLILHMHNIECQAYELISQIENFPTARCFYIELSNEEKGLPGMILMEDLGIRGKSLQVFSSVSKEMCQEVARHFATFQAHMNLKTDQKWRGKYTDCFHVGSTPLSWPKLFHQAIKYDPTKKPLLEFFLKMDFQKLGVYTLIEKPKEYNALTLAHGDAWSGNILFEVNHEGSISNKILAYIDWQTMFEANPLLDLARFMINCSDADVRQEIEKETVDLYYDVLLNNYVQNGLKPPFSREQAHELYEHAMVQEVVVLVFMFTLCALPLLDAPNGKAKVAKLWLRLCFALEDAVPLIEKYDLIRKCAK